MGVQLPGGAYRPPRTPLDPGPPARGARRVNFTARGGKFEGSGPPGRRPGVQGGPGGPEAPPVRRAFFLAETGMAPIPAVEAENETPGVQGDARFKAHGPRPRFRATFMIVRVEDLRKGYKPGQN